MQVSVISQNNSDKAILFFNGWGMDQNAVAHLKSDVFTVVHCNAYDGVRQLPSLVETASELHVVAWSLGVWEANQWLLETNQHITSATAINGTIAPISAEFGIAPDVFKGTLDGWNEANRTRFQMRMFKNRTTMASLAHALPARTCNDQINELQYFYNTAQQPAEVAKQWSKVIITSEDLIIPTAAQQAFWSNKHVFTTYDLPHYLFHGFSAWNELL